MVLILLLAGLIFLLAVTAPWAATVGTICLVVAGALVVLQIVAAILVHRTQKRMQNDLLGRFRL